MAQNASPSTPSEAWSLVVRWACDGTPALAPDGTIYLGTFAGQLLAITPDGSRKWLFRAGREIKSSPAVGGDGTIYFGCRDRHFYAVTPEGKKKWQFKTGAWVDSSPAIALDGTLYFGSWDTNFYALTPGGEKKWQFPTGGPIVSSPAIGQDGRIYFGSHDRKFYCLAPDGTKVWEFGTGDSIISSPAIDQDGTVYFTSVDGSCYAVSREGDLKWRLKTGGITESSPVLGQGGTIYVGVNGKLAAIQPDGKMKWEQPHSDPIVTPPLALSDGSVCFLSGSGVIINLAVPHQFKWYRFLGGNNSMAAIAPSGTIYAGGHVLNQGQVIYALETKVPLAESPWPKFRADPQNTGRVNSRSN
jgi:outer membrane protein assembly factor BamB